MDFQENNRDASFSVLMSVYKNDNPHFFKEAMESIWDHQTRKPDKIILIEDGPLPTTLRAEVDTWIERLGEQLIICRNEQNVGLAKALNKGIGFVTTKYIARMDSDDKSHPERFEKQIQYMESHPEIAILGGSIIEINADGEEQNKRTYPATPEESLSYIAKASPVAHPSVMIRSAVFDSGLRYSEQYKANEDIALWFEALKAGFKIASIDDTALYFRITDSTFQRRNKTKAINEFKIYMKGIYSLFGVSYKYVYPVSRLIFRLMPTAVVKTVYTKSGLRNKFLQKKKTADEINRAI